jgi:hypothetical protein
MMPMITASAIVLLPDDAFFTGGLSIMFSLCGYIDIAVLLELVY